MKYMPKSLMLNAVNIVLPALIIHHHHLEVSRHWLLRTIHEGVSCLSVVPSHLGNSLLAGVVMRAHCGEQIHDIRQDVAGEHERDSPLENGSLVLVDLLLVEDSECCAIVSH